MVTSTTRAEQTSHSVLPRSYSALLMLFGLFLVIAEPSSIVQRFVHVGSRGIVRGSVVVPRDLATRPSRLPLAVIAAGRKGGARSADRASLQMLQSSLLSRGIGSATVRDGRGETRLADKTGLSTVLFSKVRRLIAPLRPVLRTTR
jgi:hypothetical protein